MIKKINNKDKKFYMYMGKFFGSRLVERQTNDRIYDDDTKEWYVYIENNTVLAFLSIQNKIIKNNIIISQMRKRNNPIHYLA